MEKLDLKDRKILYELDIDCRQSFRSIGRKVGLSKDVVASRVKKLEKEGYILYYFTSIDSSRLGYTSFRFYINFKNTTKEIEEEIIDYFVKNKYVWIVQSLKGKYDLVVCIWIKETIDFYKFWEKTLQKYHQYFEKQVFSVYFQHYTFKINQNLFSDAKFNPDKRRYEIIGGGKVVNTDEIDKKILQNLANNARMPTIDIAKNLGLSATTVKNRMDRLTRIGVIQGFRYVGNFLKYGYKMYKTDINLIDYSKKQPIIDYILKNPHLLVISKTAGYADLELDFVVKDEAELHSILDDLVNKFPNAIKNYDYYYEPKYHKVQYIPQEFIE
ncbi:MAG: Lrp/AsnC family transcriptional regulator [Thermoplasmatales archaeon]|nr:MAG: Lrp/AsnC family transcriptional regulator [Thermoplasmatales archaeon]